MRIFREYLNDLLGSFSARTICFSRSYFCRNFMATELKRKNGAKVILESSSLSSPINMGITVSGVLVTLQISGISFYKSILTGTSSTYYLAFASIASLTLAMGLWNSFSLATLTESNGQIPVSLSNNTYLPAQLVFQFSSSFFWGHIVFFCLRFLRFRKLNKPSTSVSQII